MKATEISNRLDECYTELEKVKAMSESEVCKDYNADSKDDIIALIYEEIDALESYQGEDYSEDEPWDNHGFASESDYVRWRYGA